MYSEKYIRNLNIYANSSRIVYIVAGKIAVLIFHQSISYIAS